MAPLVVVDSGILIASVLDEKISDKAKAILNHWKEGDFQLAAPLLFRYEIVAVARKAVHQKRVKPERGVAICDSLLVYPVELYVDDTFLKRAYELATQFNRPTTYDAQYLAVAERLDCPFWTADEKLFNAVHETLSWVQWVGNFEQS